MRYICCLVPESAFIKPHALIRASASASDGRFNFDFTRLRGKPVNLKLLYSISIAFYRMLPMNSSIRQAKK